MNSFSKAILVMVVLTTLGVWGCNQSRNSPRITAARIRHLEYQNARLEEDYRDSVAEAEQLRKKLTAVLKQHSRLQEEYEALQVVIEERDVLQQRLNVSVGQRDALRVQLVQFSKDLQSLAGKVEQVASHENTKGVVSTVSMEVAQ